MVSRDRAGLTTDVVVIGGGPGGSATATMLGEAAICLAKDELASPGGVLTPAFAMGDALIERLQKTDDISFSVRDA